jgi:hypothetical protein
MKIGLKTPLRNKVTVTLLLLDLAALFPQVKLRFVTLLRYWAKKKKSGKRGVDLISDALSFGPLW